MYHSALRQGSLTLPLLTQIEGLLKLLLQLRPLSRFYLGVGVPPYFESCTFGS